MVSLHGACSWERQQRPPCASQHLLPREPSGLRGQRAEGRGPRLEPEGWDWALCGAWSSRVHSSFHNLIYTEAKSTFLISLHLPFPSHPCSQSMSEGTLAFLRFHFSQYCSSHSFASGSGGEELVTLYPPTPCPDPPVCEVLLRLFSSWVDRARLRASGENTSQQPTRSGGCADGEELWVKVVALFPSLPATFLPWGGGESLTAGPVGISCPFSIPLLGSAWCCVYRVAPKGHCSEAAS